MSRRTFESGSILTNASRWVAMSLVPLILHTALSGAQQFTQMGQDGGLIGLRRAVVSIRVETSDGSSRGSGVILNSSGVIATAAHVLDGATSVSVRTQAGITLPAEGWIHIDPALDLALLKVDASALPSAALGTSAKIEVGARLIGIGSPLGLDQTVSDGVLSAIRTDTDRTLMQVSIPVSPGSSGGPIATAEGLVVGIVVSGIRGGGAENLNFALPISYAVSALELTASRTPRPWDGTKRVVTARDRIPEAAAETLRRTPGVPSQVNDSLVFDWKALDGVTMLTENRPSSDLTRYDQTVSYTVIPDHTGSLTVERHEQTAVMTGDMQWLTTWSKWGEANERTSFSLKGRRFSVNSRSPRDNTNPNIFVTRELTVVDSVAEYKVDGSVIDRAWVPLGVIPSDLVGGAIAAMTGAMPQMTYVWTVSVNEGGKISVEPLRLRRLDKTSVRDVPVARDGSACSVRGTVKRRFEVFELELTSGANTQTSVRLSNTPHLLIDAGIKCVKLPA